MSTETTNKKIKIDNGTTFGRTYTDKAIDERLQGLVSTATFTPVKEKANNSLQKPAGLTKTQLVGVGTNGQENIEIGDNLTLANGKLSATGGGSGGESDVNYITLTGMNVSDNGEVTGSYTGTIVENKINIVTRPSDTGSNNYILNVVSRDNQDLYGDCLVPVEAHSSSSTVLILNFFDGEVHGYMQFLLGTDIKQIIKYYHFITMTDSANNVVLYLTIQNTDETELTADTLASYLTGKKLLANGNLHGAVPTYIAGEGGSIKVYYMNTGDNNINPTPDEYQDLSSFTITDLVTPVE